MIDLRHAIAILAAAFAFSGCATAPPPAAPKASIAALYQQPAERALIQGLALYDQAAFERAESAFREALGAGLADPRDVATAHKYLAFIDCAFNRIAPCEQSFRAALAADPGFALNRAEIGHPIWGPIYVRVRDEPLRK
jgi:Tfp pilus assembly protein PilF